ncbi:MAG TPA: tetratricopeptide repeat protein [Chthoniobacteraceae bacterium]
MKQTYSRSLPAILLALSLAASSGLARVAAASPSDLLEKGIYAEETKGDLDAAIAIYQQLTTEVKASQSLAAQAQWRLGLCLLKKKRDVDARAAFEKLIRDFPEEKELATKARGYLPGELALGPVTWADGERLQLTLKLPAGLEVGTMQLRADLVELKGRKVWRVGRRMSGGGEMLSSVDVDPASFHPLSSYWKHSLLGEVTAEFKPGEVVLQRAGSTEPTTVRAEKPVFDNEEAMHLMRRLPLAVGLKTVLPVMVTLGGGTQMAIGLEVPAKEVVETRAGKFDCFKVVLDIGQTFWISDDAPRYLAKFEGVGVVATLASITQRKPGTPVSFRDEELGASLTTPADWVIHRVTEEKGNTSIYLLDPAANAAHVALRLSATESLPTEARGAVRAWAENNVRENFAKKRKGFKVREASWKQHAVSGRSGVSFVADFQENQKPMIMVCIHALGGKQSEQFILAAPAEKMAALQPVFEQIVAGYRMTK